MACRFPPRPLIVTARVAPESDIKNGLPLLFARNPGAALSSQAVVGCRDLRPTLHHLLFLPLSLSRFPHRRHVLRRPTPLSSSRTPVLHVDRPPFSPPRLAPDSERAARPRPARGRSTRCPRCVVAHAGGQKVAVPRV